MKTALVTGSTRGIGFRIGYDLLNKGYFVSFNGRSEMQMNEHSVGGWNYIQADLSNINEIKKITNKVKSLDVLILNVGTTDRTKFGEITLEGWNNVFNINCTNQFFLVQLLKDKINKNGKIIFITSISGIVADSTSIPYGCSKAATNMMVAYLAKEFAYKHVTVNAVAPGYTMTSWHNGKSKEQIKRISNKCLAKRFGTTKEISKAVLSIIDNDFITSQVIRVDGGFSL